MKGSLAIQELFKNNLFTSHMYVSGCQHVQRKKKKKMGKPLTRLTSHVFEKKKVTFYFVSGFMHVHAHVYFFFSGMGNCVLVPPGGSSFR